MTDTLEAELAEIRRDRILAGLAAHMVALATGVSAQSIAAPRRIGVAVGRARYMAIYLAHVTYGWPLQRTAAAFGRDRSTAGIACRWVEDARDAPALDALLEHLESALRQSADSPRVDLEARGFIPRPPANRPAHAAASAS